MDYSLLVGVHRITWEEGCCSDFNGPSLTLERWKWWRQYYTARIDWQWSWWRISGPHVSYLQMHVYCSRLASSTFQSYPPRNYHCLWSHIQWQSVPFPHFQAPLCKQEYLHTTYPCISAHIDTQRCSAQTRAQTYTCAHTHTYAHALTLVLMLAALWQWISPVCPAFNADYGGFGATDENNRPVAEIYFMG